MGDPTGLSYLAIGSMVMSAVGAGYNAVMSYQSGRADEANARAQAEAQAALARSQAAAQQEQAAEYERQAKLEAEKAGQVQTQGMLEAERRSRARALSIGQIYADAAGNGLLVDVGGSFADILKSENLAAEEDIAIMNANTAMNVFGQMENSRSLLFAAKQQRRAANETLMSGQEALRSGYAAGSAAYRDGINSAIGDSLSALGSIGSSYLQGAKTFGQAGQRSFWNPGEWGGASASKFYGG